MHLRSLTIENVRTISEFSMDFGDEPQGWHVIIGNNGAGKSSVVRSIAIALVGPQEASAARQDWSNWRRIGAERGSVKASLAFSADFDGWSGTGRQAKKAIEVGVTFQQAESERLGPVEAKFDSHYGKRTIWGSGQGWFCSSFGPFRRFTGGDPNQNTLFFSNPKLAPHLSAFGEDVALTECLAWLRRLHVLRLEGDTLASMTLDAVVTFVNKSGLLPYGAEITDISSTRVVIRDGGGSDVAVEQLSDGFRSILSLTFELVRQMFRAFPQEGMLKHIDAEAAVIKVPGVVVIDEIDAHLHPTWQLRIGDWFVDRFPAMQFIVTTHSPIVCRAAARGSVWKLATPGTDEVSGKVEGSDLQRLIDGNILDALATDLFGKGLARSPQSQEKLGELARLNKKLVSSGLDEVEQSRRRELQAILPTKSATLAG